MYVNEYEINGKSDNNMRMLDVGEQKQTNKQNKQKISFSRTNNRKEREHTSPITKYIQNIFINK